MIQINNVTKKFTDITALEDVNIHIPKSSIYGVLGSNGAGKTTLLKLIAGIYTAEAGTVEVNQQPIFENIALKKNIIFIPDIPYFLPQYTVKQMAEYYERIYPSWDQKTFERLGKVFQINLNKKVARLSKGMQRQVAFWLAFSVKPDLMLLDEPMDGLDPVMRSQVRKMLIENVAEREMTVVIASHNLKEVEDICDIVAIIHQSKLLFERELDELRTDIHKLQIVFKDGIPNNLLEELNSLQHDKRGSVLTCIVRGEEAKLLSTVEYYLPVVVDILPLTLEEIFIYEMEATGYAFENIIDK